MSKIQLRGPEGWRGMTTLTLASVGDGRFRLLEDCYVSSDGQEIRTAPGWKTVFDFEQDGRATFPTGVGYYVDRNAKNTPVTSASGEHYLQWTTHGAFTNQLKIWSKPTHIHGVRRVGQRLVVFGEDDFYREPILNAGANAYVTVTAWTNAAQTTITLSDNWRSSFILPNGIGFEQIVFLSGAGLPAALADKFHRVVDRPAANTLLLDTTTTTAGSGINASIDVVRPGRAYGTMTYPVGQYDATGTDDAPSLVAYWSLERPEVDNVRTTCYPAHVANRQHDSSDSASDWNEGTSWSPQRQAAGSMYSPGSATIVNATDFTLGAAMPVLVTNYYVGWVVKIAGSFSYGIVTGNNSAATFFEVAGGWTDGTPAPDVAYFGGVAFSRRRQKQLPYRLNPDVAGDRLLLAAPGYGCIFQVPCVLPNDPTVAVTGNGLWIRNNDVCDMPRSLGVPKAHQWIDRDLTASSAHFYSTLKDGSVSTAGTTTTVIQDAAGGHGTLSGKGYYLRFTSGPAVDEYRPITTNTATAITVSPAFTATPTAGGGDSFIIERRGYDWAAGTYQFAVAYRDDATGETGLLSEPVTLTIGTALFGVRLFPMHPGYLMSETGALTVIVYRTTAGGSTFFRDSVVPMTAMDYRLAGTTTFDSGTANAAVTATPTTLVDTREAWATNLHMGRLVVCGGNWGIVSSNNATTLTISSWYPAQPANGLAWTITNPWLDEQQVSSQSSKYGLNQFINDPTSSTLYGKLFQLDLPFTSDVDLVTHEPATNIEQMHMGACSVRTIRAYTFSGGRLGNSGKALELYRSTLTTQYEGSSGILQTPYAHPDQITVRNSFSNPSSGLSLDGEWGCGASAIPPAYSGFSRVAGVNLLPYPALGVTLDKQQNSDAPSPDSEALAAPLQTGGKTGAQDWQRFSVDDTPLVSDAQVTPTRVWTGKTAQEAFLTLPQNIYQWSFQGEPGAVAASTNAGFLDSHEEQNIEGLFSYRGGLIACTRTDTFFQSWSEEPQPIADIAHGSFGCIAWRSEVQFDMGTAWVSDRGPVAMTSAGVQWIGRDLEAFFVGQTARYKRDRQGRMQHVWGCHDSDRGLILFGMFADRNAGTENEVTVMGVTDDERGTLVNWEDASDEARSRFPADEILVYSYRAGAWTVWVPPPGLEWQDAYRDVDAHGANRVCFWGRDRRGYALDDSFNDTNKDVVFRTAANAGTGTGPITFVGAIGGALANRGSTDDYVRVGMKVVIARGEHVVAVSTVASFTSTSVTLADSVTWELNDLLLIGTRTMTVATNYVSRQSGGGDGQTGEALRSSARYSLCSLLTSTGTGFPQFAFCRAEVETADNTAQTISTTDEDFPLSYAYLGAATTAAATHVRDLELQTGNAGGKDYSLRLTIVGGAQVKLAALDLDV